MKHIMLALVLGLVVVHADRRLTQEAVKPTAVAQQGSSSNTTSLPAVPKSYIPVMAHNTYTRMGNYFMPSGLEAVAGELGPKAPKAAAVPKPTAAAVPKPGAHIPPKSSSAGPTLVWPGPIKAEQAVPRVITRP